MLDPLTLALVLLLGFQNGWLAANRFQRWSSHTRPTWPARSQDEA